MEYFYFYFRFSKQQVLNDLSLDFILAKAVETNGHLSDFTL